METPLAQHTPTPLQTYSALHEQVNADVERVAGRSVSVTAGRLHSNGRSVVSALASKSTGQLVRVTIDAHTGERIDTTTGDIADRLHTALCTITVDTRRAYAAAWLAVFA